MNKWTVGTGDCGLILVVGDNFIVPPIEYLKPALVFGL
jgi:hypothetical protein